jgi:perosamine synthetase
MGYNYRMTNLQASILYGQIVDINKILEMKNNVFNEYKEQLKLIKNIEFQKQDENTTHSNWMFGIRFTDFDLETKKKLELYLFEAGIDTRPMFYSINKHPYLTHIECDTTNADLLQAQCLILPSYPELTKSQITFICNKIKTFLSKI